MKRSFPVALIIFALIATDTARSEQVDVTAQAKAAHAEFLLRAVPPGPAATICLVDTGVNVNPDTSGVIARLTLTGAATDRSPTLHGTQMAMFIGAPVNSYGMVGLWPSARIVSVRANVDGQDAFTPVGYINGVRTCNDHARLYGVKVIALPFSSGFALTADEAQALKDEVDGARTLGISVVAAGGNTGGQPVGTPANVAGVLSVGATDSASGGPCAFSASAALLFAPGCTLNGAGPATGAPVTNQQGTSHAAAVVSAALAALRTWRPDLGPDEANRLLNESGMPAAWGRSLNLAAAFTAAGLGAVAAPPTVAAPPPSSTPAPTVTERLPKPKVRTRMTGRGAKRKLTVRASNRPQGARMVVRVYARGHRGRLRRVASRTRASGSVHIRVRSSRRVTARYVDPTRQRRDSLTTSLVRRR